VTNDDLCACAASVHQTMPTTLFFIYVVKTLTNSCFFINKMYFSKTFCSIYFISHSYFLCYIYITLSMLFYFLYFTCDCVSETSGMRIRWLYRFLTSRQMRNHFICLYWYYSVHFPLKIETGLGFVIRLRHVV